MCGIAGIIDNTRNPEELTGLMGKMLAIQHHRGPDATGIWTDQSVVLGHNRLSIIDLSDAANQPMHYGSLSLIFNGEIYNYVEIGKELASLGHKFITHSDTEIILRAFSQWGDACVNRFVGMWSFAIWDNQRKRLFVSRDRFGIKPFHYIFDSGKLYFASEIKTLKSSPLFSNDLNLWQVARGLQLGWLSYHDETYFEKVKALPAAHNLVWESGNITVSSYWSLNTTESFQGDFKAKCEHFESLFRDSIRIHLRSDVPVASCLSGGLDSSAIVSMVQELHPESRYKTFSIYYDGDGDVDERPFIREVIKKYPKVEPVYFKPSDEDVREHFKRALSHLDAPASGSSFISQYFLMKLISENNIKVVLDGQGADEYLGGYMHSFYRIVGGLLASGRVGKALSVEKAINGRLGNNGIDAMTHFAKSALAATMSEQSLYKQEYRNYFPFLSLMDSTPSPFELKDPAGTRLTKFLYHLLFTTSLPSLLQYEDRNSMAFSVESRVPFLDHRLVEFCFRLDDDDKVNITDTKYIMRESLKQVLPSAIYSRKDKKGFVTPGESKWLRGPLSGLLDNRPEDLPFLRAKDAKKILDDYRRGDNSKSTLAWRLAVLGEWIKM